jgi:hypothetical protein
MPVRGIIKGRVSAAQKVPLSSDNQRVGKIRSADVRVIFAGIETRDRE